MKRTRSRSTIEGTGGQTGLPGVFWAILLAMLLVWGAMTFGTAPRIEDMAGGLRLPDMRFTGYSAQDIRAFLTALGEEGRALYLGPQMWLDTLFPPLYGAVLFLTYRWLFPGLVGLVIGISALSSVVVDLLENAALAALLRAGAEGMTDGMVATANQWTMMKWSFALLGLVALGVGAVLRLRAMPAQREG